MKIISKKSRLFLSTLTFVSIAALAVLLTAVPASADVPLAEADLGNGDLTGGGFCWGFNAEVPGNWGGEYGLGAVTAFPDDDDPAGYCEIEWTEGKARHIQLRVLDGLANDSFVVYVQNPGCQMEMVYSYTDQYSTETWVTHEIYGFPGGKGQGPHIYLMIVPTSLGWPGFNTYGQLAVDYTRVFEH